MRGLSGASCDTHTPGGLVAGFLQARRDGVFGLQGWATRRADDLSLGVKECWAVVGWQSGTPQ